MDYNNINKLFNHIFVLTNSAKLRSLQYRIVHYRVTLNPFLKRCGIKNTDQCIFCESYKVIAIITYVRVEDLTLSLEIVLFNEIHNDPRNIANLLCLIAKQYLYRTRCKGSQIKVVAFSREIENYRDTEKYNAVKFNKLSKFLKKWHNENMQTNDFENVIRDNFTEEYVELMH